MPLRKVLGMRSAGTNHAGRSTIPSRVPSLASFVGRTYELARLDSMLAAAADGTGGVALLVGEAGIGKTRIAEEFAERSRAQGVRVAWGRCWEREVCPAFGPWSEILRGLMGERGDAQLRALLGEGAEDIAVILPELRRGLGEVAAPLKLATNEAPQRLDGSLSHFLRSAGRLEPVLIVLDNLHMADDSSLRFFRHLGPEVVSSRLLIVGTCRTTGEALREAVVLTLGELAKAHSFLRLELTGLGKGEVRDLVARGLGPSLEVADRINERTEGNPLFVVELVRQMLADPRADSTGGPLPEGIRQTIRRRLQGLSPACRALLATAAVLGPNFDADSLSRTQEREDRGRMLDLVAEAEALAVLRAGEPGLGRFHFTHELVREAILESIPAAEQTRLHERAALVLERIESADGQRRSIEILHHLVESATLVEPGRLVERTIRAVDEATQRYAPEQALRIVDETLRVWEGLGRTVDARVAPLLHRRGRLLTDLLRPVEARESLVRAFDLYEKAGDRAAAVDVALTPASDSPAGTLWWTSEGMPGRGLPELRERALALAPAGSKEHALLLFWRGSRADLLGTLEFARKAGEKHLEALALAHIAAHEVAVWEMDACARWLALAQAAAEAEGDYVLLLTCAYIRYWHGVSTGGLQGASSAVEAIFDLARQSRSLAARSLGLRCAADLAMAQGDWGKARRQARECIELLASSGPVLNLYQAHQVLIRTELQTGHFKAARTWMKSAAAGGMWPEALDPRVASIGARITGDDSLLPPAPRSFEIPSTDGPMFVDILGEAQWAAQLAAIHGDSAAASFCLEQLRRWKGTRSAALLGRLCSVLGRFDEGAEHLEDAVAFCRRAGYLPELAWTLSDLADTLVRRDGPGDRQRAQGVLDEGLAICQRLGMTPLQKKILAARGRLAGPQGSRRAQPDGLSHREIEVLRLVSQGLTNAEIAERLYVSPLTVARHVHNLLDKTGMANRAEVTAWAAKRGFLET